MAESKERFVPIGVKLIGIISAILVLALAGMTVLATGYFSTEVERTVKLNTLDRAELISQRLDTELSGLVDRGRLLASSLEGGISYGGTGGKLSSLFFQQDRNLLAAALVVRSKGGYAIAKSTLNDERLEEIAPDGYKPSAWLAGLDAQFASSFGGSTGVGNASTAFNYPVVALSFPFVLAGEGRAESIAVIYAAMDRILEAIQSRELYVNILTGSGGEIIAHPDQKLVVARASLRNSPIVRDSLTSSVELKQTRYQEGGKSYYGTYKKFFSGTLTVFSIVEEALALQAVYAIQRQNILITVMVICASILLIFFYSKSITKPVGRLMEGAKRVAEGDFAIAIPRTTHDELGRLSVAFNGMSKGLADREKLKTAFGKFVNKEVAERVLRDEISLGGEAKEAAIFFSDIRSFTSISEKLLPHEVVEFLNDYMTRMVACVNKTHGVVDKYIGDAIMAVWGVPYSVGNDTENAINGALMMRAALAEYNAAVKGTRKPPLKIGCGINSGSVIAGQIGSLERMEYTVIGDAVNLASRIESLNKPFRTDLLISQASYELVKGIFKVEPMKKITVKGKAEPQQIYAVVGRLDDPACPADLDAVRVMVGWPTGSLGEVDAESHEEKYEIIE
jgi:adenylate cyclase